MQMRLRLYVVGLLSIVLTSFYFLWHLHERAGLPWLYIVFMGVVIIAAFGMLTAAKIDNYGLSDSNHFLFVSSIIICIVSLVFSVILGIVAGSEFNFLFGKMLGEIIGFFAWVVSLVAVVFVFWGISELLEIISEKISLLIERKLV